MNNKLLTFVAVMVGTVLGGGSYAFASTVPADPTDGALVDVQNRVITWVVTYGVPTLFALIILGILIRLGVKWAKKAGRSV